MKILQISSARHFGGCERHVADLSCGLTERGHEVFVAVRPTCDWQKRLDRIPPDRRLQVSIRNSFGVFSAKRIAGFVRDNAIDVVHAHVPRDYIPASIGCLGARAKFVITRHALVPLKPFNRFALKNLSAAIGVSDGICDALRGVFPAEKVCLIKNGISIAGDAPAALDDARNEFRSLHGIPAEAPLIGCIGELRESKGQRDLVLAAQQIVKKIPDARFVLVGKDHTADRSFRRDLKRLVRVLELDGRFLFLDWLDDTTPFFAAIDVYVSASHAESFGFAMLEAMAYGKPVVTTGTEGARLLLGDAGRMVRIQQPVELAETVISLLRDENALRNYGNRLRAIAAENFSLERMVTQTEELYARICGD